MFLGIVGASMSKEINKKIDSIKTGDLLHYCPADMSEQSHDIGIIYEIFNEGQAKCFKIFWGRHQDYDIYSARTLSIKLNKIISKQKMMHLIKQGDA